MLILIANTTLGLLDAQGLWLIVVFFVITLILFILPDWPKFKYWITDYVMIYSPFLFIGVYFREFEKKCISMSFLFTLIVCTIFMYCYSIPSVQPIWMNARFSVLGVLVFSMLYWKRLKIILPAWAIILSELTYGVYLFHNFLFEYFCKTLPKSDFPRFFSLIALTLFCYVLHRLIEKPGILIGRSLIIRLKKFHPTFK